MKEGKVHMYDVCILPPWNREYKRTDKQLYHDTIAEWKKVCPAAKANNHAWVFDGHKQLFCTKAFRVEDLPDQKVTVWWAEEERHVDMLVKDVTLVNTIPISKDLLFNRQEWGGASRRIASIGHHFEGGGQPRREVLQYRPAIFSTRQRHS